VKILYFGWGRFRESITLLEGSQASPGCPDRSTVRLNV